MKAKSYLDKRSEVLPGTTASLFVTDGWRGGGRGDGERAWFLHVFMFLCYGRD